MTWVDLILRTLAEISLAILGITFLAAALMVWLVDRIDRRSTGSTGSAKERER
jgi:hypothetical protein